MKLLSSSIMIAAVLLFAPGIGRAQNDNMPAEPAVPVPEAASSGNAKPEGTDTETPKADSPKSAAAEPAGKEAENKTKENKTAESTAGEEQADDLLAGHSIHGETFNEGPRQAAVLMPGTGSIHFPLEHDNPNVQKFVEQGIGQLHGFWYFEAERSFRQAAMLDPECAIAYWGMAKANMGNEKRAKGFLAEAVARKEQANARDRILIEAADDYLNSSDKKPQKVKRYVAAMEKLVAEHPDDVEAKAQLGYALYKYRGHLKMSHEDVDARLKEVLQLEPLHPVHHYRIHLWDAKDPKRALDSAALCGSAAPGIAHMWHMPGHIYSRLKRYEEAAWQQEASARVDHAQMIQYQVMPDQIHNFAHNNEWLIRNLIHLGQVQDAIDLAKNMTELPQHPKYNTIRRRGSAYYGRTRLFDVLTTFELWEELVSLSATPYLEPTDNEQEQLKRLRWLGVAHANLGQTAAAQEQIDELQRRLVPVREKMAADKEKQKAEKEKNPKAKQKKLPNLADPFEKAIAAIEGHLAFHSGNVKDALPKLRQAREDALLIAKAQCLAGDKEAAAKAALAAVKSKEKQVQPLALSVEVLWLADKRDEARDAFEQLRDASSKIQFGSPVFTRLEPIAAALELPADWRKVIPRGDDFGERPSLDSLGPFRWRPVPAKDWKLADHLGKSHALRDYRGKPVVVIFYLGYGCLHCAEQLQAFAPLTKQYQEAGISLIAISTDNPTDLKISVDNYEGGMPFPLVSDERLEVFKRYRAYDDFEKTPLHGTYLIDGQGFIRWQDIGFEPFMDPKFLLAEAQRLLAQTSVAPAAEVDAVTEAQQQERLRAIDPQGIPGSLVLGGPDVPAAAYTTFFDLAKRDNARLVVLQVGAGDATRADVRQLFDAWESNGAPALHVFRLQSTTQANAPDVVTALQNATAVWFSGQDTVAMREVMIGSAVEQECVALLERGGVVGSSAAMSTLLAQVAFFDDQSAVTTRGIDLLPGSLVDMAAAGRDHHARLVDVLADHAAHVGYEIGPQAALVVRGRRIRVLGKGSVTVRMSTNEQGSFERTYRQQEQADLVALRRLAWERSGTVFPAAKPEVPKVEDGTLIVIGGGRTPDGLLKRFVDLAGGKDASIVIFPTALPDPLPEKNSMEELLKKEGAGKVTVLTGRTRDVVESEAFLETLRGATGLWCGGGRQWRFVDAYLGTAAHELMHEVLRRGGVVAGSSAGASIQAEFLARGDPLGNRNILAPGYQRGLGFLPGVAIDQHFSQRGRQPDMTELVDTYPQLLGIGIDESTALVVQGSVAEVVGPHHVSFYDRNKPVVAGKPDYEVVHTGGRYDLAQRKILDPGKQPTKPTQDAGKSKREETSAEPAEPAEPTVAGAGAE